MPHKEEVAYACQHDSLPYREITDLRAVRPVALGPPDTTKEAYICPGMKTSCFHGK